jgi:hypothetical protein
MPLISKTKIRTALTFDFGFLVSDTFGLSTGAFGGFSCFVLKGPSIMARTVAQTIGSFQQDLSQLNFRSYFGRDEQTTMSSEHLQQL